MVIFPLAPDQITAQMWPISSHQAAVHTGIHHMNYLYTNRNE